ncbi:MAG TPA: hypothetical protein VEF34_08195, partial [Syntrophobacteraceae bacterium]|nr:hypothetical protein [Syntrophobacteraceae bacterium]
MPTDEKAAQLTANPVWNELKSHYQKIRDIHLRKLFAEDPGRAERFTVEAAGVVFDYSKNRVNSETMSLLVRLARSCNLSERIEA